MIRNVTKKFHKSFKDIGLSKIVEVSEKINKIAPEFEQRTGKPFIRFQRGELNFHTPFYILDKLMATVYEKGKTNYPKSGGERVLKHAILNYFSEWIGIKGIDEDNIVCTYGGQEGLQLVFCLFRGQRVAAFSPCWSCMLDNIFPYAEIKPILIPLEEVGNQIVFDSNRLEEVLKRVDLFYLNSPHNPTGKVFSFEELDSINFLCKKNNVLIISDEPYKDIVYDGKKHISMLEFDNPDSISVFSFSKSFAATGLRIGYSISRNKEIIEAMTKGDYTQTAAVVTPIQYAFAEALNNKKERDTWLKSFIKSLQKRRNIVYDGLKNFFDEIYKPEGAFYFFPNLKKFYPSVDIRAIDSCILKSFLENGIGIVPGSAFGKNYAGYIRISFSAIEENIIKEGINRIIKVLKK